MRERLKNSASLESKEKVTKTIFLISPVRNISSEEEKLISEYVQRLENEVNIVYWPFRDNPLEKTNRVLDICVENMEAIKKSDEVHIWFSSTSEGSRIDIGTVIALNKKLVLANPEAIKPTKKKSFNNLLIALAKLKQ